MGFGPKRGKLQFPRLRSFEWNFQSALAIQVFARSGKNITEVLIALRECAVPRGVASVFPIYSAYARNAELWDYEGNRFIDFASGIAVVNTGHSATSADSVPWSPLSLYRTAARTSLTPK